MGCVTWIRFEKSNLLKKKKNEDGVPAMAQWVKDPTAVARVTVEV